MLSFCCRCSLPLMFTPRLLSSRHGCKWQGAVTASPRAPSLLSCPTLVLALLLALLCLTPASAHGAGDPRSPSAGRVGFGTFKHVLVIGIDGLGGRYLEEVDPSSIPAFTRFRDGPHTYQARCVMPPTSKPNWASLMNSAEPEQSGVVDESWFPSPVSSLEECAPRGIQDRACSECVVCRGTAAAARPHVLEGYSEQEVRVVLYDRCRVYAESSQLMRICLQFLVDSLPSMYAAMRSGVVSGDDLCVVPCDDPLPSIIQEQLEQSTPPPASRRTSARVGAARDERGFGASEEGGDDAGEEGGDASREERGDGSVPVPAGPSLSHPFVVPTAFGSVVASGRSTALIIQDPTLNILVEPDALSSVTLALHIDNVTESLVQLANSGSFPGLAMAQYSYLDDIGHAHGWGSQEFEAGIRELNLHLDRVYTALGTAGILKETLVMLTADHGGEITGHSNVLLNTMTVPFLARGGEQLLRSSYEITTNVRVMDVPATALYALGIDAPDEWLGKPVVEIFREPLKRGESVEENGGRDKDMSVGSSEAAELENEEGVGVEAEDTVGADVRSTRDHVVGVGASEARMSRRRTQVPLHERSQEDSFVPDIDHVVIVGVSGLSGAMLSHMRTLQWVDEIDPPPPPPAAPSGATTAQSHGSQAQESAHSGEEEGSDMAPPHECLACDQAERSLVQRNTVDWLLSRAVYTLRARAAIPPTSLVNWASVMLGAGPEEHGVTTETWLPPPSAPNLPPITSGPFPSIFSLASASHTPAAAAAAAGDTSPARIHSTACFSFSPLALLFQPDEVDEVISAESDFEMLSECVNSISKAREEEPTQRHLILVQFSQVLARAQKQCPADAAADGVDAALEVLDHHLAMLLYSLQRNAMYNNSLLLLTSDHGFSENGAKCVDKSCLNVPWIAYHPHISPRQVYRYVRNMDLASTAAFYLGLKPPAAWSSRRVPLAFDASTFSALAVTQSPAPPPPDKEESAVNISVLLTVCGIALLLLVGGGVAVNNYVQASEETFGDALARSASQKLSKIPIVMPDAALAAEAGGDAGVGEL